MKAEFTPLFDAEEQANQVGKKTPVKKGSKPKRAPILYAEFTPQEIMEFFDWGIIFPNGYLQLLIPENDFKSRFQVVQIDFSIRYVEELYSTDQYYLEFNSSDLDPFLLNGNECYFTQTPVPSNIVKRIVCKSDKEREEFLRLWNFTDNDAIEVIVQEFKEHEKPSQVIEVQQATKDEVLDFIRNLDRCLGAVCFTKDLDLFIKHTFHGYPGADEFSDMTLSRRFLLLIHDWMPSKFKKVLEHSTTPATETEKKYIEFFNKIISKNWDNLPNRIYLEALSKHTSINSITAEITNFTDDEEQVRVSQKLKKALKEIDCGIIDFQTALDDEDLKKPYPLFLMLLKLYYRKGKLETDAQAFRASLLEKDFIKNPKQITLIGTLYGYYTGYHNLRKYENNQFTAELDISTDKEILELFRLKLSINDNFEKEAFNVIYNKVAENYFTIPQVKINLKVQKEAKKEIVKEVGLKDGERIVFKFVNSPQFGQYCYMLVIPTGQNKFIKRLITTIEKLFKTRLTKVAGLLIVSEFLKENKVQVKDVFSNVKLLYASGQFDFDIDIDMKVLSKRLEDYYENVKNRQQFLESLNTTANMLDYLILQNNP